MATTASGPVAVKVPGVGESITEGILAKWLKADGSAVKADEPLYELETDKANNVINAPASGTLKIGVKAGATVPIGAQVATIDPAGAPTASAPAPAAPSAPSKPAPTTPPPPAPAQAGEPTLSPAVRRVVAETGVDPSAVTGTGKDGRLTKGDVLQAAEPRSAPAPAPTVPTAAPEAPQVSTTSGRKETREKMSKLRQTIAKRLVEAQQTAAILTTFNEADMSRVMDLRNQYKDAFKTKHGVNLGFMSFFIKAAVEALKAFPRVNGRIEGDEIVLIRNYDIGVAVSTERGLLVPVLRDADQKTFAALEKEIVHFAGKARENRIEVSDLQGGTFTITNGGVFGSLLSTPILNPPQSGILGMHTIQKRPVAINDQVVIRPMMYLALSYDHRIIDGREAVSFLVRIKELIESPERLMLDV